MTSTQERPESTVPRAGLPARGTAQERAARIRRRLERLIGIAATEGNALTALRNGDEIFPFTGTLDSHFDDDVRAAALIREGRWKRRSVLQRARETAVVPVRRFL